MFSQHYQYLLLLSGPIATLQAAVPRITALDSEWCYNSTCKFKLVSFCSLLYDNEALLQQYTYVTVYMWV